MTYAIANPLQQTTVIIEEVEHVVGIFFLWNGGNAVIALRRGRRTKKVTNVVGILFDLMGAIWLHWQWQGSTVPQPQRNLNRCEQGRMALEFGINRYSVCPVLATVIYSVFYSKSPPYLTYHYHLMSEDMIAPDLHIVFLACCLPSVVLNLPMPPTSVAWGGRMGEIVKYIENTGYILLTFVNSTWRLFVPNLSEFMEQVLPIFYYSGYAHVEWAK